MTTKHSVLGKGIGALLNQSNTNTNNSNTIQKSNYNPMLMDISLIKANKDQPRKIFNEASLQELSNSIKENGIIQPLIVVPNEDSDDFMIIAGERRFRAAQLAGLKQVPVVVKKVTQKDTMIMAIIENVQRSDLNCVEEAMAYYNLINQFKLTQEEVATKIGKSRSVIANLLRILTLPNEVLLLLKNNDLSFGHAKILASLKEEKEIVYLAHQVKQKNLSVRELEALLATKKKTNVDTQMRTNEFSPRLDTIKNKLEKCTGFHFALNMNPKGVGEVKVKFNNEAELNDIITYFISRSNG